MAVRLPLSEAATTRYKSGAVVKASCSIKLGWKVTTIKTREVTKANDDPADENVYVIEEKVADEDKASLEEEDADGKVNAVRQRTLIKSR